MGTAHEQGAQTAVERALARGTQKRLTPHTAAKLAAALNVDRDWLVCG